MEIAIPVRVAGMSVLHFSLGTTFEAIDVKLKRVGESSIDADQTNTGVNDKPLRYKNHF